MRQTKTNQPEPISNQTMELPVVLNNLQINETPIRDQTVIVLNKRQIFNEIIVSIIVIFIFVFVIRPDWVQWPKFREL